MGKAAREGRGVFDRHFLPIDATTSDEALAQIGGDFTVSKRDLMAQNNETEEFDIGVPRYAAIVRDDNHDVLSVLSSNYGVVQYSQALACTEGLVTGGDAVYEAGYVLGLGERIVILMSDSGVIELGDGSRILNRFTVSTTHDGTGAFEIQPNPVFEETGTVFTFGRGDKIWTKHSKKVEARVECLKDKLALIQKHFHKFGETMKACTKIQLANDDVEAYFHSIIEGDSTRAQNVRDRLHAIYIGGPQTAFAGAKGTLWGAYLAVCEHADREKVVRKSDRWNEASAEISSLLDGDAARQKAEAYAEMLNVIKTMGGFTI